MSRLDEIEAIRGRCGFGYGLDFERVAKDDGWAVGHLQAWRDRDTLLAEVDRLTDKIAKMDAEVEAEAPYVDL